MRLRRLRPRRKEGLTMLFGVKPVDPRTFAMAAGVLGLVALRNALPATGFPPLGIFED